MSPGDRVIVIEPGPIPLGNGNGNGHWSIWRGARGTVVSGDDRASYVTVEFDGMYPGRASLPAAIFRTLDAVEVVAEVATRPDSRVGGA